MRETSAHPAPHSRRILVVDDSPANRYSLSRVLRARGWETLECSGGSEALKLAKENVAGIVLDVHLPDLHGFEVCRLLRAEPVTASIPIIHVSAIHVSAEDRLSGFAAGADAYYVNPVEPEVLTATLDALVRARESTRSLAEHERLFRGAFDKAPCAMLVIDAEGRIAEANSAFVKLMRSTRRALAGRAISGLVPKEWKEHVQGAVEGWARQPWDGRFPLITPAGERLPLTWNVARHPVPGWSVACAAESPGVDTAPPRPA